MSTAELAVIALVRALVAKARKGHNGREGFWAIGACDVRDLALALEACEINTAEYGVNVQRMDRHR